jgi:hypothetical protein
MNTKFHIGLIMFCISIPAMFIGIHFDKKKEAMGRKPWEAYDQSLPINNPADWLSSMAIGGIIGGIVLIVLGLFNK